MICYTDILSIDDRHAADSRPLGSHRYVDRVITAGIDRHSMECLRKVGFYSPSIDRLSTDMSIECRSLVSIDSRPRVPLVHMIPDGNSFLGLYSHHICNGKPPDKATWHLMAMETTHTNQENSALLSFSVDVKFWSYGIFTLEAKKSFVLDFHHTIVIQTSIITRLKSQHHILILKYKNCWSHLCVWKTFWRTSRSKIKGRRFRFLSLKWHMVKKHCKILCMGE